MTWRGAMVVIVLLCQSNASAALRVEWEFAYGKENRTYNPSAIAAGPERTLFVAGTSTAPGLSGSDPEFWLWKVDGTGKVVAEAVIARGRPDDTIASALDLVRDIAVSRGGDGALLIEFRPGDPYFVTFDERLAITGIVRLEIPERRAIALHRLLRLEDGTYFAVGTADRKAILLRINSAGTVTVMKLVDGLDGFLDAVLTDRGELAGLGYAAANKGQLSLRFYGLDLSPLRSVPVPGRKGSVTAGPRKEPAVVYDASSDDEQLVVAGVVQGETIGGAVTLPVLAKSFTPEFRIAARGPERYLIGGTGEEGVSFFEYGRGSVLSELVLKLDRQPRHWMLKRITGMPTTALTIVYTADKELTTKVGLIRFREN